VLATALKATVRRRPMIIRVSFLIEGVCGGKRERERGRERRPSWSPMKMATNK